MNTKKGDQNQGAVVEVEVETTRRLKVGEFAFEEITGENGQAISLTGPGISNRELTEDEIGAFVRFFVGFQRRQGRGGDDGGATDGRGEVRDAAHDGRLKGNEAERPNDPDRSKSSGRKQ